MSDEGADTTGAASSTWAAAIELGRRLRDEGDFDGAVKAFRRAMDSADPRQSSVAALRVAEVLDSQGDTAGAIAAYQRALDSGEPFAAARAAGQLALLRKKETGARAAVPSVAPTNKPAEERVLLNVEVRNHSGKGSKRIVATDHRLHLDGRELRLDQVTAVKYHVTQKTTTKQLGPGLKKITTFPLEREFYVDGEGPLFATVTFRDDEPGGSDAWAKLVGYSQQLIEPRLCRLIVSELRAGGTYVVMKPTLKLKVQIELNSKEFTVHGRLGKTVCPWSSFHEAVLHVTKDLGGPQLSVQIYATDPKGKTHKRATVSAGEKGGAMLATLMPFCKQAFG